MTIDKIMNKNISDLSKIMSVDTNNLSKFVGHSVSTYMQAFYSTASRDDGHCVNGLLDKSWEGLALGYFGGDSYENYFIFKNVTIPQGATITEAFVKGTAMGNESGTTVNLDLNFGDIDNAIEPDDCNDITNTVRTSTVNWNGVAAWTDGVQYNTPELKTILQTVINRAGWSSGNTISFFIADDSSSSYRGMSSYDHLSGTRKPELWVSWTT